MENLIFFDCGIWGLFILPCDLGNPISPRWQRLGLRRKKKKRGSISGRWAQGLHKGAGSVPPPAHGGRGHPVSPGMARGEGMGLGLPSPCAWAVSPRPGLGWHWGWGQPPARLWGGVSCVPPRPVCCRVPGCCGGGGRGMAALGDSSCGGKGANYPGWVTSPPNPALLGAAPRPPAA